MPKFKEGDRVQVRTRPPQGREAQEGRYAPHLANAVGTVLKVYTPQEIAVALDLESLPEAVRERHAEQQTRMHERWLNSLSEEARNRLTDDEKSFHLRYVALLAEEDLLPLKASAQSAANSPPSAKTSSTRDAKAQSEPRTAAASAPREPIARPTPEQLEQQEERYLNARKRRTQR
jgi:hypothetical protein